MFPKGLQYQVAAASRRFPNEKSERHLLLLFATQRGLARVRRPDDLPLEVRPGDFAGRELDLKAQRQAKKEARAAAKIWQKGSQQIWTPSYVDTAAGRKLMKAMKANI